MKVCPKCSRKLPLTDFYKSKKYEYQSWCKSCQGEARKRYKPDERVRTIKRHGLTEPQYEELSADGCHICGSCEGLVVDHDHACCSGGYGCPSCVRGVLCASCNKGLGFFRDDVELLRKASDYLKSSVR